MSFHFAVLTLFWPVQHGTRGLGAKAKTGLPSFQTQRKKQWNSHAAVGHVTREKGKRPHGDAEATHAP